jgi:hypothetical protein
VSDFLKLEELVDRNRIDQGIWVKFKDTTFEIRVGYYGRDQMKKVWEQSKDIEVDPRTLRTEEKLNDERFKEQYVEKVIKEWKGLTEDVLRRLIVLRTNMDLPPGFEVPCTKENKLFLINNSVEFDQWLSLVVSNVANFNNNRQEAELKNS